MSKAGRPLDYNRRLQILKEISENPKSTISKLAGRLGADRATVSKFRRELIAAGYSVLAGEPLVEPAKPATVLELHDETFWRRKAKKAETEVGKMGRVIEELGGVRNVPVQIPEWLLKPKSGKRGRAVLGGMISDIHDGEIIRADEIQGANSYDPDICETRLKRYFYAANTIGNRWASDCNVEGFLLTLNGDMISGDIHEELRITNACTSHEQVMHVVGLLAAGIRTLLEAYPAVHVVGTPGNHGRTTIKPTAKLYADLNYDMMVLAMLQERFKGDGRVTWQYGKSKDQLTPVFRRTILTTHGDKLGTRGGQGFAGVMLPILRGSKKILEQQGSLGRRPDLIQTAHYHSTGNPYLGAMPILSNGSVIGVSEYADDLRVAVEPPQQWLYLLHDEWWLRERQPVILTDLEAPEKPRVKIPAGMAA